LIPSAVPNNGKRSRHCEIQEKTCRRILYNVIFDIYLFIKSIKIIGMAGHVARMSEGKGRIGFCWGNWREGDRWGDLGVDGSIILGWISRRWDVGIWTGLCWLRIETCGGRL